MPLRNPAFWTSNQHWQDPVLTLLTFVNVWKRFTIYDSLYDGIIPHFSHKWGFLTIQFFGWSARLIWWLKMFGPLWSPPREGFQKQSTCSPNKEKFTTVSTCLDLSFSHKRNEEIQNESDIVFTGQWMAWCPEDDCVACYLDRLFMAP